MMTRGYVVIMEGRKIVQAGYSYSDSYLSGLGKDVLKAFQNHSMGMLINSLEKEDDIRPEWYRKTKSSHSGNLLAEYAYEFHQKQNLLKIFYYGKLLCEVTSDTIEKICFAVEHEEELFQSLLYDAEKMSLQYDMVKLYQIIRKMTLEDLQKAVLEKPDIQFLLDDDHLVDCWHRPDYPAYLKVLHIFEKKGTRAEIRFHCYRDFGKWHLSIQLPYIRRGITPTTFRSETAAMKWLRLFIQQNAQDLINFAEVCTLYEETKAKISQSRDQKENGNILFKFQLKLSEYDSYFLKKSSMSTYQLSSELMKKYNI